MGALMRAMAGSVLHLMTMMLLLGIPGSTGQAQLGPLASCAGDVSTSGPLATCILQATNISAINVDIPAVADCLEEYRNSLSASCVSALEQFVVQEGRDGDLDREVADQETTESESQIEAEDEICDARLMQVCRTELIAATFTGSTTRLTDCAQRHLTEVGQACVAMAVHASSDGLLAHMRRCGFKAIEYCPAQALALSAAAAAGFDNIDLTSILSLGSCLRDHAQQMRQGCMGFIDSVADVVATLSSQASDRFNDEESNVQDPTSAPTPPAPPNTPATPPATVLMATLVTKLLITKAREVVRIHLEEAPQQVIARVARTTPRVITVTVLAPDRSL